MGCASSVGAAPPSAPMVEHVWSSASRITEACGYEKRVGEGGGRGRRRMSMGGAHAPRTRGTHTCARVRVCACARVRTSSSLSMLKQSAGPKRQA